MIQQCSLSKSHVRSVHHVEDSIFEFLIGTQWPCPQWALEDWCHFLEGCPKPFEIFTDHKNLGYFRKAQRLNHWQACWSVYLSRFNFTLHHHAAQLMGKPDTLSRQPNHPNGAVDNHGITLLPKALFEVCSTETILLDADDSFLTRIHNCKEMDTSVAKVLMNLSDKRLVSDEWEH